MEVYIDVLDKKMRYNGKRTRQNEAIFYLCCCLTKLVKQLKFQNWFLKTELEITRFEMVRLEETNWVYVLGR